MHTVHTLLTSYFILHTHTSMFSIFFFFNDTATTEIYTLSLHDALPISFRKPRPDHHFSLNGWTDFLRKLGSNALQHNFRSEEHTSELQSHSDLVCRLLLEKKKKIKKI